MTGKFKVRRDRILFVDFELTCWEDAPPAGEEPEIVEIGLAEIDVSSRLCTRAHSFLVIPERSAISPYCENLTGISAAMVRKNGRPLREISATLKKEWGTANKAWMAWGADRAAILRDCRVKNVENPFSEAFHNLGQQFSFLVGGSSSIGLNDAHRMLGLERSGKIHRGMEDALAAAQVWLALAGRLQSALAGKPVPAAHGLSP